jgi:hypothetical protein
VIRIGVSQSEIAPWLQSLNTARAGFLFWTMLNLGKTLQ